MLLDYYIYFHIQICTNTHSIKIEFPNSNFGHLQIQVAAGHTADGIWLVGDGGLRTLSPPIRANTFPRLKGGHMGRGRSLWVEDKTPGQGGKPM